MRPHLSQWHYRHQLLVSAYKLSHLTQILLKIICSAEDAYGFQYRCGRDKILCVKGMITCSWHQNPKSKTMSFGILPHLAKLGMVTYYNN